MKKVALTLAAIIGALAVATSAQASTINTPAQPSAVSTADNIFKPAASYYVSDITQNYNTSSYPTSQDVPSSYFFYDYTRGMGGNLSLYQLFNRGTYWEAHYQGYVHD